MSALRISPVHDHLQALRPAWGRINGMTVAVEIPGSRRSALEIADLSCLARVGLKGPGAAEWLRARDVTVPERPNAWVALAGHGLIARLGRAEFLIQDGPQDGVVSMLRKALETPAPGVYPVLRQDCELLVCGELVHELFAQTCNINFNAIPAEEQTVTMTMMVGVAVTVLTAGFGRTPCYRIWCDGTYGAYLWNTLLEIATELGGGAVGLASVLPDGGSTATSIEKR